MPHKQRKMSLNEFRALWNNRPENETQKAFGARIGLSASAVGKYIAEIKEWKGEVDERWRSGESPTNRMRRMRQEYLRWAEDSAKRGNAAMMRLLFQGSGLLKEVDNEANRPEKKVPVIQLPTKKPIGAPVDPEVVKLDQQREERRERRMREAGQANNYADTGS